MEGPWSPKPMDPIAGFAVGRAASPAYLDRHGRPQHPRLPAQPQRRDDAVGARVQRRGGAGRSLRPLLVQAGAATELAVEAAIVAAFSELRNPR